MSDASVLLRDIAGDAATNAAGKVRPGEEKLSQIDRPAEDNTWHDAPDLSKDNLRKQLQSSYKGNDPEKDASAVLENAQAAGHDEKGFDANAGVDAAKHTVKERTGISSEDTDAAKEAARKRTAEYRARTQDYLRKKMPQERREQTIWRLKASLPR